jgi:ABC-type Mn2+/Zn2+ transport system permease subunit
LFWASDEESARAFGVPVARTKLLLMTLLALAIVTAMKLAGVILATALLSLPGATALRLSRRLWWAVGLSIASGVFGLAGGFALSIEANWPTGPSVVACLAFAFVLAWVWGWASTLFAGARRG